MSERIFPAVERLIKAGQASLTVAVRVVKFSRHAFYKWLVRERKDIDICKAIREIHDDDPEFGYRLIADELADRGYQLSELCVWRLCFRAQVFSVITRRKPRGRKSGAPVHDDLLQGHFHADGFNIAWVTDITEH
ncbi:IS3 family transposase [Trueperella pyogenes]|uniref:IS3 family transposase n=1 Tax=Trueperella pyogenes TaxID=1661 RepID=UPI00312B4716